MFRSPSPTHSESPGCVRGRSRAHAATFPDDTVLDLAARRLSVLGPSLSEHDLRAALSQFDLISCLIIREADPEGFYPNASKFSESLAEPVVYERLRDENDPLRQYVYPGDRRLTGPRACGSSPRNPPNAPGGVARAALGRALVLGARDSHLLVLPYLTGPLR